MIRLTRAGHGPRGRGHGGWPGRCWRGAGRRSTASVTRRHGRGRRTVTVYLVGAGPGDPGLLTRRGAELLARADVVLHDRLVSRGRPRPGAPGATLIDVGKDPDAAPGGTARQDEIARLLVEHGRRVRGGGPAQGRRPVPLRPRRRGGRGAGPGGHPLGGRPGRDLRLRCPGRRRHPGHPARPGLVGHGGHGPGRRAGRRRGPPTGRRWPGRAGRSSSSWA